MKNYMSIILGYDSLIEHRCNKCHSEWEDTRRYGHCLACASTDLSVKEIKFNQTERWSKATEWKHDKKAA